MIQRLKEKVQALALEISELSDTRENLIQHINNVDNRVTQIVGAIETLNELIKELETSTDSTSSAEKSSEK